MRILIFGAGVTGSNLARNLQKAGKNITLLARGKRADEIEQNGLTISYRYSLRKSVNRINLIRELKNDDFYDMIFVTVKYNQLKDVTAALSENHSKNICFIGNNVNCSFMEETLPSKNIFFAYSFCSGYRDENIVYSLDFKRIIIGKINSGSLNQELIKQIFKNTGYRIFFEPDIESWLLCRAAFLIPLALACYHCNGKLLKIRWDTVYQNKILDAIIEGYRSIKKSGHKIIPQKKSRFETPLWRFKKLLQFRSMFGFKLSRILISDYAMNSRAEFSALDKDFKDFMNRNCASCDVWKHLEIE